ncbi:unnamed protein product [Lactuca virosa]|uniref:Uncharacterized protein n=1 Tax=Lactuca virosa TaxID=75947 RepID=A0AAU9MN61_9ASTR|nr:unnamed protein product [Lactuca virosa]
MRTTITHNNLQLSPQSTGVAFTDSTTPPSMSSSIYKRIFKSNRGLSFLTFKSNRIADGGKKRNLVVTKLYKELVFSLGKMHNHGSVD